MGKLREEIHVSIGIINGIFYRKRERRGERRQVYTSYRTHAVGVQRTRALPHKAATVQNNTGDREVDDE